MNLETLFSVAGVLAMAATKYYCADNYYAVSNGAVQRIETVEDDLDHWYRATKGFRKRYIPELLNPEVSS